MDKLPCYHQASLVRYACTVANAMQQIGHRLKANTMDRQLTKPEGQRRAVSKKIRKSQRWPSRLTRENPNRVR
jgi:hypothetical protein